MLRTKRIYEAPSEEDGYRVLVERLWPRGMTKERAAVDLWLKEVAPSNDLRRWFGHDPAKWEEFKARYRAELQANPAGWERLRQLAAEHEVLTLVYASREQRYNVATTLAEFLESGLAPETPG
jgi:uncharacterized protein YeaO (DUF488 family)